MKDRISTKAKARGNIAHHGISLARAFEPASTRRQAGQSLRLWRGNGGFRAVGPGIRGRVLCPLAVSRFVAIVSWPIQACAAQDRKQVSNGMSAKWGKDD